MKTFFLLFFLYTVEAMGQITCPASIPAGGTGTCTSGTSVSWSASGSATVSPSTGTSTTVTMPSGITAQHKMLGCPVTPNDSIFNTRIDSLPADTNSSTKATNAGTISGYYYTLVFEPLMGVSRANNSTPTQSIRGYYSQGTQTTVPIPTGRASVVENGNYSGITGWFVNSQPNPDHHRMTVNYQTCNFYDMYDYYLNNVYRLNSGTTTPTMQAQSIGVTGLGYSVVAPGGTDAAGLPLAPLVWTADEIRAGVPKHAVRFTSKGAQFAANIWKWPASATAGGYYYATYGTNGDSTNYIALGSRLRLQSNFTSGSGVCTTGHGVISGTACNIGTICVSPLTANQITYCQNMLTSLQQYGMINSDSGDSMAITPSEDVSADVDVFAAMTAIQNANIAITNFDVVDEDSLFYALNTYETTPNGSTSYPQTGTAAYGGITYSPATQSYETAVNQVIVTGGSNKAIVAIQPVLIGHSLPLSGLVVAQNASIDLSQNSWVNPSSGSQVITWSLPITGCGSFSGTVYTAPSSVSSPTSCSFHGVASADSAATVDIAFTLLPAPSGAVRIDSGSTTTTQDANGYNWYPETGVTGQYTTDSTSYSYWNGPNQKQYATEPHGISDMRYTMIVPNGNYKVHLLLGYSMCAIPCGTWPNSTYVPENWSLHQIETQDIITNHLLDWSYATSYAGYADSGAYSPATVTNNILSVSLQILVPDVNCNAAQSSANCTDFFSGSSWVGPNTAPPTSYYDAVFNTMGGIEVLPDSTAAYLAIDLTTQVCNGAPNTNGCSSPYACGSKIIQPNQICAGQTLTPIYPQPWYFSLSGTTTWTLHDPTGKASIVTNSDGSVSLSLASGSVLGGQPIQLTATNSSYTSAPLTIYTVGNSYAINPKPLYNHYAYVRSITIHHAQVAASQTNFPVLISITDPTLATTVNGGNVQNAKGYDIVFASNSSGTPTLIPWEVESYNSTTGALIAHVLISSLSSLADTVVYVFYGNNAVLSPQNSSTATSVWNSSFNGVYHFGSTVSGLSLNDSTSYGRTLQATNPSPTSTTGIIGLGVNGFSSGTLLTIPTATLNQNSGTIEGWINTSLSQSNSWDVFSTNDGSSPSAVWMFNHPYNSGIDFGWAGSGSIITVPFSSLVTPVNTWHHIAYTYSNSAQAVYEDGALVYSLSSGVTSYTPTYRPVIGTYTPSPGYYFQGILDELRFSNIPQTASWIQTEYNSYSAPSTFFSLGTQTVN